MPDSKPRTYTISGLSTIALTDGKIVHKVMIRLRGKHRRRAEVWIDCTDDFCYEIGDTVTVQKVRPYRIITQEGSGTDEQHGQV